MEYRTLGRTDLSISLLSMGTGGYGILGQRDARPESEAHKLLFKAFDLGINLFDTAPAYGDSDLILGRAIKKLPRNDLIVSTKVHLVNGDSGRLKTPDEVAESVETSLRRLQISHIDILFIGSPLARHYDAIVSDLLPVLYKLQDQGKVKFIGSNEKSSTDGAHEWLELTLPLNFFDVIMVAYNMINQSARHMVLPMCDQYNVGVLNMLAVRNLFWNPSRLREVIKDLKQRGLIPETGESDKRPLAWLLEESDVSSLVEAAYRFAAYTEGVSSVLTGTIEISHLEQNVLSIAKGPLSSHQTQRLEKLFGLVSEAVGD